MIDGGGSEGVSMVVVTEYERRLDLELEVRGRVQGGDCNEDGYVREPGTTATAQCAHNANPPHPPHTHHPQSGGNVRLEEGSPDDLWYQSCSDLVTSRFQASDYDALATCVPGLRIASVAVTRVVRVHNRHLRGAFERESDAVAARMAKAGALPQGGSGRSPVEYLFYGVDPRMGGGEAELIRIAEEGFR